MCTYMIMSTFIYTYMFISVYIWRERYTWMVLRLVYAKLEYVLYIVPIRFWLRFCVQVGVARGALWSGLQRYLGGSQGPKVLQERPGFQGFQGSYQRRRRILGITVSLCFLDRIRIMKFKLSHSISFLISTRRQAIVKVLRYAD